MKTLAMILALGSALLASACDESRKDSSREGTDGATETVAVSGTLVRTSAVGGETTGYGLEKPAGEVLELDLTTHGLTEDFEEGTSATVKGHFETVDGVESGERQVLVVTEFEKTPGDDPEDPEDPEEKTFTGRLFRMNAVGGETTGFGLETASGRDIELDLSTHGLAGEFESGITATVKGHFETVEGVESGERRVLVVTELDKESGDDPGDPEDPEEKTFTGRLFRMNAVGGETTGYGLRTASGQTVELDLTTHGLASKFEPGKAVIATGRFKRVEGVEIPCRLVLEVTQMTSTKRGNPGQNRVPQGNTPVQKGLAHPSHKCS